MDEEPLVDGDDQSAGTAAHASSGRRRRGKRLMFELTAPDLISLAVNVAQNGWTNEEAGIDVNMRKTLEDIYAQILIGNRIEIEKAMARARKQLRRWTGKTRT